MIDDAGLLADRLRDPGLRRSSLRVPGGGDGRGDGGGDGVTISVDEVQRAFTSSLPILASDARSAVLSSGAEFHEAILRLVRAHPSLSLPLPLPRPLPLPLTLSLTLNPPNPNPNPNPKP